MKMVDIMNGYLSKRELLLEDLSVVSTKDLPVKTQKNLDWELRDNPPRFYRRIKFKNHDRFLNFLISLLNYENEIKHNAKIVIGYPEIILQVWTHNLESITDMDREYCKEVDSILKEL